MPWEVLQARICHSLPAKSSLAEDAEGRPRYPPAGWPFPAGKNTLVQRGLVALAEPILRSCIFHSCLSSKPWSVVLQLLGTVSHQSGTELVCKSG